jgi:hypothetical protein
MARRRRSRPPDSTCVTFAAVSVWPRPAVFSAYLSRLTESMSVGTIATPFFAMSASVESATW